MRETRVSVSELIDEAVGFAVGAWREAWAPMAIVAVGWMLIILGGHAQLTPDLAGFCVKLGWVLLLAYWPLLGALYRFGVGGAARRRLGPGGLQFGEVEWRILAVNAVLGFLFLLTFMPLLLLSALSYVALRRLGSVNLGPAGPWAWWFLLSAVFGAGLFIWLAYLAGRLSMATPLSVDRRRTLPFSGWPLTEGLGRTIAIAFTLAHIPALAVWLGLQTFGWTEPADVPVGLRGAWPLPQAAGVGLLAGMVLSAIQAPLSVGLLMGCYDLLAPLKDDLPAVDPSIAETVPEPASPADEEVLVEPEPDPPFSTVEFFPHPGRFSRIAAPWLADEPTPEPYARWLTPDLKSSEAEPPPPETYPHSVVEYSPHSGRFSRLFSPWLSHQVQAETEGDAAPATAESEAEPTEERAAAPPALDAVDEAEHAEP